MSTCTYCRGQGTYREGLDSTVLLRCPTCLGTGCEHVSTKAIGHCAVCEQDSACRACNRANPPKPDTRDDVTT